MPGHAMSVYDRMIKRWPGDPAILIAQFEIACYYDDAPVPTLEQIHDSMRRFDGQVIATVNMLDRVARDLELGHCKRFPVAALQALVTEVLATRSFDPYRYNVLLLRARIAARSNDYPTARA